MINYATVVYIKQLENGELECYKLFNTAVAKRVKPGTNDIEAILYFIKNSSFCRSSYGEHCVFPEMKKDDIIILNYGTPKETTMLITDVTYFVSKVISHIRLSLLQYDNSEIIGMLKNEYFNN